ncbi:hypothetical protein NEMIN01_2356 [Nematocida minor]|uniref:uncharacterized protein n=1 Tax=Nematocida minor TaxID=1912983 RepID=UPI00221EE8BE|nr:uncharacterized protein NEMIN01_2356 [Nematocida minor]KAI5193012.1 hypothetical protein NEMIN01_2356 [Nematocida minor]
MGVEKIEVEMPEEMEVDELSDDKVSHEKIDFSTTKTAQEDIAENTTQTMKKVTLKINLEGILDACQSSKIINIAETPIEFSPDLNYLNILENILDRNIEIESAQYSGEEKNALVNIIKNNSKSHFVLRDRNEIEIINDLLKSIKSRNEEKIKYSAVRLLNDIIVPNLFVYNPEQGINMQIDMKKAPERLIPTASNTGLGSREYTLEIDDTKFTNLESLYWSSSVNLSREFFSRTLNLHCLVDMNVLRKYSSEKKYYTLDELYNTKHKKTNLPLADYGLNLIFEKINEIRALVKEIKAAEAASDKNALNEIKEKIRKSFSPGDLGIAVSVYNNIGYIIHEKKIHMHIVESLQYIANRDKALKEKNGPKTWRIKTDLSNFYKNYVANIDLKKIIKDRITDLAKENDINCSSRTQKKKECKEKEEKLEEWKRTNKTGSKSYARIESKKMQEIESLKYDINRLRNDINLLEWKTKKEKLRLKNIRDIQDDFRCVSKLTSGQKNHLVKEIEELGEMHSVKVKKVQVPEKVTAPHIKEVKLVIDLEGILKDYNTIGSKYNMEELLRSYDLSHITILRHVLDKNIRIESELYSDEEKKFLENAIKKRMYEYFMYIDETNENGTMFDLKKRLRYSRNNPNYNNTPTRLLDDLMEPNIFIYNAEHGINMQYDMDKALESLGIGDVNQNLDTREYTLEIDDTKFTNLESLYWSASMSLSREFFCVSHNLRDLVDMNILTKYSSEEKHYALEELYNTKYKKTNVSLADYGLSLIFEKLSEIRALDRKIKAAEAASDSVALNEIKKEISALFSSGDLGIAVSVYNNIGYITCEKEIHNSSIKTLEYIVNSDKVLEKKDGQKILKLNTDLSTFYKDHITSTGLEKIVNDTIYEIIREREENSSSCAQKKKECKEKEAKLEEWKRTTKSDSQDYDQIEDEKIEEIESLKCDINRLNNENILLTRKLRKERIQLKNIIKVKNSFEHLSLISSDQKKYLIEKMKELLEAHGVKIVVDGVETELSRLKISEQSEVNDALKEHQELEMEVDEAPEERGLLLSKKNQSKLFKIISFGICLVGMSKLVSVFSNYKTKNASDSENDEQPPIKRFRRYEPGNTN